MTPKKHDRVRIYWRAGRAYGDFRDFADVGGKRIPLCVDGSRVATTDPAEAEALAAAELARLVAARRKREVLGRELGIRRSVGLEEFGAHHLVLKKESGRFTDQWLESVEMHLRYAAEFLGAERELHTIGVPDVQRFAAWLLRQPIRGGKATLSSASARKYLNSLSNLYQRAQAEAVVPPGFNPVRSMLDKPTARHREAKWLEAHEVALLLESARTYQPKRGDRALPFLYPLLATFALTGGRSSEVLGLEVDDVSLDRRTVTFRPNQWRRLKTGTSFRTVPLWPQLEEILRTYLFGGDSPRTSGLLFPSHLADPTKPAMLTDWRKALDQVAIRAGWKAGEVRSRAFRHGYCAARLQTLDRGAPVSIYTVGKELGHGGDSMVKRVYGHLGAIRHRSEVVEFRVEQHQDALSARLSLLQTKR